MRDDIICFEKFYYFGTLLVILGLTNSFISGTSRGPLNDIERKRETWTMRFEEGRESVPMRCIEIKNGSEARIIDNHRRGIARVNTIIMVHEVDAAPSEKQRKLLSVGTEMPH